MLLERIHMAIGAPDRLDAWLTYDLERRRATGPLILGLVAAAETGSMPAGHLVLAWDYLVFDRAARAALELFPVLRQYQGRSLDDLVQPLCGSRRGGDGGQANTDRGSPACEAGPQRYFHQVGLQT